MLHTKIKIALILILFIGQNALSYSRLPDEIPLAKSHDLMLFLNTVRNNNPLPTNKSFIGTIKIRFERDSNFNVINTETVHLAHPHYDSIIQQALRNASVRVLRTLDENQKYSISIEVGDKKIQEDWHIKALILYADEDYKKVVKIMRKLHNGSPHNTEFMYHLGRSLDKLNELEGMEFIREAAKIGDEEAIKYLNLKYSKSLK